MQLHCLLDRPKPRSVTNTSSARFQRQVEAQETRNRAFIEADKVSTLADLKKRLGQDNLCRGFSILHQEDELFFLLLQNDVNFGLRVTHSLQVSSDLAFSAHCNEKKIPSKQFANVCSSDTSQIESLTDLENILALLRSIEDARLRTKLEDLSIFLSKIEEAIEDNVDEELQNKLFFLTEQIKLSLMDERARRYSPQLLSTALLWQLQSPSLYEQILEENLLNLPSTRHLKRISQEASRKSSVPLVSL